MVEREDETTQQRLFKAAIQVFADKGYRDATVREICKVAGSANINAVNYYFGSKEQLYRRILEAIFAKYDQYELADWDQLSPQQQLRSMIMAFCSMLYKGDAVTSKITTIFVAEMLRPSPFIKDLVDTYNRPRLARHYKMIRGLLAEDASEDLVRDCLVSIAGQLFYYSFTWPVFSRLFPDYSPDEQYEHWVEHVYQFSLGGIAAVKAQHLKTRR